MILPNNYINFIIQKSRSYGSYGNKGVYIMDKDKLIIDTMTEISKLHDKAKVKAFALSLAHAENGRNPSPFVHRPEKV
jgi:hypothetical protein